jgi:anthranilate/para-aminobenzoate synthase component I
MIGNLTDWIQAISSLITLLIVVYFSRQEKKRDMSAITIKELFDQYKIVISSIDKATIELTDLIKKIKKRKNDFDFNKLYFSDKYTNLRNLGFFYEMIGTMANEKVLKFESIFSYFIFPYEFFQKSTALIELISKERLIPDFWIGFINLFIMYDNKKIKTDIAWKINGIEHNPKEMITCLQMSKKEDNTKIIRSKRR